MKEIQLNKGFVAFVDDEDFEHFNKHKWMISDGGYAVRNLPMVNSVRHGFSRMHREILGLKKRDGVVVDHINGNKLDNRKENLRFCTISQNGMNRSHERKNKIGLKGVSWDKANKKWLVVIGYGAGIQKHIGRFSNPEDAHKAYCEAALKYHGEFANFGNDKQKELVKC